MVGCFQGHPNTGAENRSAGAENGIVLFQHPLHLVANRVSAWDGVVPILEGKYRFGPWQVTKVLPDAG
jgi:hypothetical protein